jgi:hypothetical protein
VLACLATGGNPDANPAGENRPPSSEVTGAGEAEQETLAFGKSYTWDDGVTVTVGKPKKFKPSEYAAAEKAKGYLKFTVTVVNNSDKPLDLGLTYITVQSSNKEAEHERFRRRFCLCCRASAWCGCCFLLPFGAEQTRGSTNHVETTLGAYCWVVICGSTGGRNSE